ncbi:Transthyretin-like family protein [Ancylostoma ceylanicum]|nr:Transthyretin-like family protein [Ancylostoma ceylanicum]EYC32336.1 hypothetical protein Y032_0003g1522 [Ancylostoma ceylanicum]
MDVKGILRCNNEPVGEVIVKLYAIEKGFSRKLNEGKTNADGTFMLQGTTKEISKINPQLVIYHKCNHKGRCSKKTTIEMFSRFIENRNNVVWNYDIGPVELSMEKATIDCKH